MGVGLMIACLSLTSLLPKWPPERPACAGPLPALDEGRTSWTVQDAFLLRAEVIEEKTKPSASIGERAEDAFGHRPEFPERGAIERALVNVWREDVVVEGLVPLDPRLTILGASSDYLIVDVGAAAGQVRATRSHSPSYATLLALMSSPYVDKRVVGEA